MAIKFQYNKTSLGELDKQLKMREKALPTIKSKESALRMEVKRAKRESDAYEEELAALIARYDYMKPLWGEFDPQMISVEDIELSETKIAGVRLPVLESIVFAEKEYNLFFGRGVVARRCRTP